MKSSTSFTFLLLGTILLQASHISVYQDQTLYTYVPSSTFIGISNSVKAKCAGESVPLYSVTHCPEDKRLCKALNRLKETEQKLNAVKANSEVLEKLITLPQPTSYDAKAWIESARLVGEEKAELLEKNRVLSEKLLLQKQAFQKQTRAKNALLSKNICHKTMTLTIPSSYISFSTSYEAEMSDTDEIKVTQLLKVTNRSGIDMEAEQADFYYRRANQYVRPLHFNPWIVKKDVPQKEKRVIRSKMMRIDAASAGDVLAAPAPVASYVDAREYQVKNIELPSNGVPQTFTLHSWATSVKCRIEAYAYLNRSAFNVCYFKPKYQIESNLWKISRDNVTLNEQARGEYYEGQYRLYTSVDEDIKIVRKQIVKNERKTGIFDTTVRKKDGFTIDVSNKSDKIKKLTLIDRIPVSENKAIEVKLLKVKAERSVTYKRLNDGKLEITLELKPQQRQKIEVLFEISYDKDLKITY